jgi:methanogenic corrinoid protein MtbC1
MEEVIEKIAVCVERGKVNRLSPYPHDMKDQEGTDEITAAALKNGVRPAAILDGCMLGMERIGRLFSENKVFIPDLLMAEKAMSAAMKQLKPFFKSGEVKPRGRFVIGTVFGDLHDIGKKLASMIIEGYGFEVIDLGVDVSTENFLHAIQENPGCAVGMSALLTTTMTNMEKNVKAIRERFPGTKILIGGAPVTLQFCRQIGADFYSPDLQDAAAYLSKTVAQ